MIFRSLISPDGDWIVNNEPGGGPRIVDTSGYVPAKVRIKALIQAGVNLAAMQGTYHFSPDEDVPLDLRALPRSMDLADASQVVEDMRSTISGLPRKKPDEEPEPTKEGVVDDTPESKEGD